MFAGQTKSLVGFFRGIKTKHGALYLAADAVNATEIIVFSKNNSFIYFLQTESHFLKTETKFFLFLVKIGIKKDF